MNRICRPVSSFSIHPEYVAIVLTRTTIAAIMISVYSPLHVLLDAPPAWYEATLSVSPPPWPLFCLLPVQ